MELDDVHDRQGLVGNCVRPLACKRSNWKQLAFTAGEFLGTTSFNSKLRRVTLNPNFQVAVLHTRFDRANPPSGKCRLNSFAAKNNHLEFRNRTPNKFVDSSIGRLVPVFA